MLYFDISYRKVHVIQKQKNDINVDRYTISILLGEKNVFYMRNFTGAILQVHVIQKQKNYINVDRQTISILLGEKKLFYRRNLSFL